MKSNLLDSFEPEDLRIVSSNTITDDDGKISVAVYSFKMDAVTWVDVAEEQQLLSAGVKVIESLPDDTEVEQVLS